MQEVNVLIAADVPDGRFITAAIALLDPIEHRLRLYSAGHGPLYYYSAATKQVTSFNADQPPLGCWLKENDPLSTARIIPLSPGDSLILVTDGFFECSNGTTGRCWACLRWRNLSEVLRLNLRSNSSLICINMFWNFRRDSRRRMI